MTTASAVASRERSDGSAILARTGTVIRPIFEARKELEGAVDTGSVKV
jgi:hypothetical protein